MIFSFALCKLELTSEVITQVNQRCNTLFKNNRNIVNILWSTDERKGDRKIFQDIKTHLQAANPKHRQPEIKN